MTDLAELKRLAEAAKEITWSPDDRALQQAFIRAASPSTILSLIQRVEEAEASNEALRDAAQCGCGYDAAEDQCLPHRRIATEAREEGRIAGIEEAAGKADLVRSRMEATLKTGRCLNQVDEHTASVCDGLAQAIRALKEKANDA